MNFGMRLLTSLILLVVQDLHLAFAQNDPAKVDIRQKVQQSQKAFQENKHQEVIDLISPHIESLDRNSLLNLAKSYAEIGNQSLAIRMAQLITGKNPKDLQAKTFIATQYVTQRKEKDAVNLLKEVLNENSKYLPAYDVLINIYSQRKDASQNAKKTTRYELRLVYQDMLEKIGESPKYLENLCRLSTQDGLYEIAEKYCSRGIELDPKNAENHVYLGVCHLMTGREKSGDAILKNAASRFSKSYLAQERYAARLAEQKNFVDAFKYYTKATELAPNESDLWIGLGQTAIEIQKYEVSLQSFVRNCEINKKVAPAFRAAVSTLRTNKASDWVTKFQLAIDSCFLNKAD